MSIFVILLTFIFQAMICRAAVLTCPKPFVDTLGVCLHFPTNAPMSWCDAQKYCSSVEGELVRGTNFAHLSGKSFHGNPKHYWIGLTDFLHERRNETDGWRWTDGTVAKSSELIWYNSNEPGDLGYGDCIFQCFGEGKLCDLGCQNSSTYPIVPMCQQRPQKHFAPEKVTKYGAESIRAGLPQCEYATGNGCTEQLTSVESPMDCARLCNSNPGDWCVAFYFHERRKICQLVMYTEANIKKGTGWIKFAKK